MARITSKPNVYCRGRFSESCFTPWLMGTLAPHPAKTCDRSQVLKLCQWQGDPPLPILCEEDFLGKLRQCWPIVQCLLSSKKEKLISLDIDHIITIMNKRWNAYCTILGTLFLGFSSDNSQERSLRWFKLTCSYKHSPTRERVGFVSFGIYLLLQYTHTETAWLVYGLKTRGVSKSGCYST